MKRSIAATMFVVIFACDPQETPPAPSKNMTQNAAVTNTARSDAGAAPLAAASVSGVTRHLPGTVITTATGKYAYLVMSNGTISPFATNALAAASGYAASMVVTVTAEELYCYGRGDQITAALAAPGGNRLREGALVKEKGRTDTYVVSDGVAWPIVSGQVFVEAGYDFANVVELPAGTLFARVEAVGDCASGMACLERDYLYSCAQDDAAAVAPIATREATATATSATTSVAVTVSATVTQTATSVATNTTSVTTADATATAITATVATTSSATSTAAASASATPSISSSQTWVWKGEGTKVCLNARYVLPGSTTRAVLHTLDGPWITGNRAGPVSEKDAQGRFCWNFADKLVGKYMLWSDVADPACSVDWCRSDGDNGNGAQYGTALQATLDESHWLRCVAGAGCEGAIRWDGVFIAPAGD